MYALGRSSQTLASTVIGISPAWLGLPLPMEKPPEADIDAGDPHIDDLRGTNRTGVRVRWWTAIAAKRG